MRIKDFSCTSMLQFLSTGLPGSEPVGPSPDPKKPKRNDTSDQNDEEKDVCKTRPEGLVAKSASLGPAEIEEVYGTDFSILPRKEEDGTLDREYYLSKINFTMSKYGKIQTIDVYDKDRSCKEHKREEATGKPNYTQPSD